MHFIVLKKGFIVISLWNILKRVLEVADFFVFSNEFGVALYRMRWAAEGACSQFLRNILFHPHFVLSS